MDKKLFNIVWAISVIVCGGSYIQHGNWYALGWMVTAIIVSLVSQNHIKELSHTIKYLRKAYYHEAYEVIRDKRGQPVHILWNN